MFQGWFGCEEGRDRLKNKNRKKEREKIDKEKGKEIRNKKEEKLHFKKCLISKILKLPINSNL